MNLPQALLDALEGIKGYNRQTFLAVHNSGEQVTSIRFNPLKTDNGQPGADMDQAINQDSSMNNNPLPTADCRLPIPDSHFTSHLSHFTMTPIPWSSHGYYLSERPSFTFDPAFHGGLYYVQEASSMFLEQALKQTTDLNKDIRVLDLCAAPGGKSTLIQSSLHLPASWSAMMLSNPGQPSWKRTSPNGARPIPSLPTTIPPTLHGSKTSLMYWWSMRPAVAVVYSGAMKKPLQNGANKMYTYVPSVSNAYWPIAGQPSKKVVYSSIPPVPIPRKKMSK